MLDFAKLLIFVWVLLVVIGAFILIFSKFWISFGKLPGDIIIKRENFIFYFPITSGVLLSIILTILLNIFLKIFFK